MASRYGPAGHAASGTTLVRDVENPQRSATAENYAALETSGCGDCVTQRTRAPSSRSSSSSVELERGERLLVRGDPAVLDRVAPQRGGAQLGVDRAAARPRARASARAASSARRCASAAAQQRGAAARPSELGGAGGVDRRLDRAGDAEDGAPARRSRSGGAHARRRRARAGARRRAPPRASASARPSTAARSHSRARLRRPAAPAAARSRSSARNFSSSSSAPRRATASRCASQGRPARPGGWRTFTRRLAAVVRVERASESIVSSARGSRETTRQPRSSVSSSERFSSALLARGTRRSSRPRTRAGAARRRQRVLAEDLGQLARAGAPRRPARRAARPARGGRRACGPGPAPRRISRDSEPSGSNGG